jgi:hypothetical protein
MASMECPPFFIKGFKLKLKIGAFPFLKDQNPTPIYKLKTMHTKCS